MASTQQMPIRAGMDAPQEHANPTNDPASTTGLLTERLQAWKHMCGYLEDYISEVAKDQKSQAKDQEKISKVLSHPLKENHHFDQNLGGVVGLFENLRTNTQAQIALHNETSKNLTGAVLPVLERLHSEIKNKAKELEKGAGKGTKAVESARVASQKHIELLGQHSASFDTAGTKTTAATDPYVLQKGVLHRLNKQLSEENNNRGDLVAVQNSFQQFEAHVLQTVQKALSDFNQYMSGQADRQKIMYSDIAGNAAKIPLDFEWGGFLHRNGDKLIDPNAPHRNINTVTFPNQGHRSTQALIEGSLERKGRGLGSLGGYSSGFYAVTPAGFLHEFKDNDNFQNDPQPEHSLYLPDCIVGALAGNKFTIKGKDSSANKLLQKMSTSSEYQFKAASTQDAEQWYSIISQHINSTSSSLPTSPVSPTGQQQIPPIDTHTAAATETKSPVAPQSATSTTHPQQVPQQAGVAGTTGVPQSTVTPAGTTSVPQSATSATAPNAHFYPQSGAQPQGGA